MSWWWLSFSDPNKPQGQQFIGACMVEASSLPAALQEASVEGCNPGGEVAALELPSEAEDDDGFKATPKYRLLTKEEIPGAVSLEEIEGG